MQRRRERDPALPALMVFPAAAGQPPHKAAPQALCRAHLTPGLPVSHGRHTSNAPHCPGTSPRSVFHLTAWHLGCLKRAPIPLQALLLLDLPTAELHENSSTQVPPWP
ncbi:hypothetical protein NDU88_001744 [Pleurodeles waltl]|uniref:Uncharacterized protein n=1 Tax=Pleurodeles waltl TaxID=8319 RepID=A0AAV7SB97_PLEWA|nr:hypothetical protein NDU88_001744 [Pleurodeles waltl]